MAANKKPGRPPGPRWTPSLRKFVEELKAGKQPTEAARLVYPNYHAPAIKAHRLMKNLLVIAALAEYEELRKASERMRASVEGAIVGRANGLKRAEHFELLADIARNRAMSPAARISAIMGSAELNGMRIKQTQNVTDRFEGFTKEELELYYQNGTVPERFAIRFGLPAGGSKAVM